MVDGGGRLWVVVGGGRWWWMVDENGLKKDVSREIFNMFCYMESVK